MILICTLIHKYIHANANAITMLKHTILNLSMFTKVRYFRKTSGLFIQQGACPGDQVSTCFHWLTALFCWWDRALQTFIHSNNCLIKCKCIFQDHLFHLLALNAVISLLIMPAIIISYLHDVAWLPSQSGEISSPGRENRIRFQRYGADISLTELSCFWVLLEKYKSPTNKP